MQPLPKLQLYKYDTCPFCVMVMREIDRLGIAVEMLDTRQDPAAKARLREVGGKTQVPCLFIDGKPMYESVDIVDYLRKLAKTRH